MRFKDQNKPPMVIGPFARTIAAVPEYPQPLQKSPPGTNEKQRHFNAALCNPYIRPEDKRKPAATLI